MSCDDNDWTITTCKKNLNFQQAKDDAFEAVLEQVVENVGKEYVEWIFGAKPQTRGRAHLNYTSMEVAYHNLIKIEIALTCVL